MIKKLSLLLAAVAVLAFAAPSMASASAVTFPAGTLLATGNPLELTGTNILFTSSITGEIGCEKLNLIGTLTKNNGTEVEGSGVAEKPVQEKCKTTEGAAVTITNWTTTKFLLTTTGNGTINFDAVVDEPPLTCTVVGTNVPFTYAVGGDNVAFNKAGGITVSPAGCGTLKLDGSFTVETKISGVQHAVILE
jgi:hypothetical protein